VPEAASQIASSNPLNPSLCPGLTTKPRSSPNSQLRHFYSVADEQVDRYSKPALRIRRPGERQDCHLCAIRSPCPSSPGGPLLPDLNCGCWEGWYLRSPVDAAYRLPEHSSRLHDHREYNTAFQLGLVHRQFIICANRPVPWKSSELVSPHLTAYLTLKRYTDRRSRAPTSPGRASDLSSTR